MAYTIIKNQTKKRTPRNNLITLAALTLLSFKGAILLTSWQANLVMAQTAEDQIGNRVYQQASPAVVTIKTGLGHGSGFIVSKDGLIITNAHVLQDAPEVVTVVFSDGRKVSADVIGFAKNGVDLAALRIYNHSNLPTLPLANFNQVKEAYRVFAIGTPLDEAYSNTITEGTVGKINRPEGIILHNADISLGNSGGPLLNSDAQVIGVNTAIRTVQVIGSDGKPIGRPQGGSGLNFAISVDRVQDFITAIGRNDVSKVSTVRDDETLPIPAITLNAQAIEGNLTKGDPIKEENGCYVDIYEFKGSAGQRLTIEMNSVELNSLLELHKVEMPNSQEPESTLVAINDDRGAGDFNAIITTTLPENGTYWVIASSKERGETGKYSLRATANP